MRNRVVRNLTTTPVPNRQRSTADCRPNLGEQRISVLQISLENQRRHLSFTEAEVRMPEETNGFNIDD